MLPRAVDGERDTPEAAGAALLAGDRRRLSVRSAAARLITLEIARVAGAAVAAVAGAADADIDLLLVDARDAEHALRALDAVFAAPVFARAAGAAARARRVAAGHPLLQPVAVRVAAHLEERVVLAAAQRAHLGERAVAIAAVEHALGDALAGVADVARLADAVVERAHRVRRLRAGAVGTAAYGAVRVGLAASASLGDLARGTPTELHARAEQPARRHEAAIRTSCLTILAGERRRRARLAVGAGVALAAAAVGVAADLARALRLAGRLARVGRGVADVAARAATALGAAAVVVAARLAGAVGHADHLALPRARVARRGRIGAFGALLSAPIVLATRLAHARRHTRGGAARARAGVAGLAAGAVGALAGAAVALAAGLARAARNATTRRHALFGSNVADLAAAGTNGAGRATAVVLATGLAGARGGAGLGDRDAGLRLRVAELVRAGAVGAERAAAVGRTAEAVHAARDAAAAASGARARRSPGRARRARLPAAAAPFTGLAGGAAGTTSRRGLFGIAAARHREGRGAREDDRASDGEAGVHVRTLGARDRSRCCDRTSGDRSSSTCCVHRVWAGPPRRGGRRRCSPGTRPTSRSRR